jgi:BirA family biotin operon repressor/biotin-[acetyl-CoA-carboxylase] ligase
MDRTDLEILSLINNQKLSGETIAKKLNISRVAVWKRIRRLIEKGYKIEVSKTGYRLLEKIDRIFFPELEKLLKTKYIGRKFIYFDEINSTNIYLKENKNLPDGIVVVAERQTAGRGRKGRKWNSPKYKGLYFSILLQKDIEIKNLSIFSLLFPLAVKEAIQNRTSKKVYIKWPNDIYIENKKISGILIETEIEGNSINNFIVGIGINVNTSLDELGELAEIGTSLFIEEGKEFNRTEILADILNLIEEKIENFNPEKTALEINKNLLWKNQIVKILDNNIEGRLIGINKEGALILDSYDGLKAIYSGDLSIRKIN